MPTLLDHVQIEKDTSFEEFDGESLIPLIFGKYMEEKIAYTETGNPLDEKKPPRVPNTKSVRTSEWKLILNEYNGEKELYNLINDPNETQNLIGQHKEIEEKLWNELLILNNPHSKN